MCLIVYKMAGEVIRWSSAEEVVGGFCGSSLLPSELHVLAVDDSLVDRKVIERLLRISSCRVTTVDSWMRALQYLGLDGDDNTDGINDLKINLIMTDYSMPGMTGYELLKKIKGSMSFREVPVVIMSSENVLTHVNRCLKEGAEDFLMKPVKLSDVKRLKEFVIRGEIEEMENRKVAKRKLQDDHHRRMFHPCISLLLKRRCLTYQLPHYQVLYCRRSSSCKEESSQVPCI